MHKALLVCSREPLVLGAGIAGAQGRERCSYPHLYHIGYLMALGGLAALLARLLIISHS